MADMVPFEEIPSQSRRKLKLTLSQGSKGMKVVSRAVVVYMYTRREDQSDKGSSKT